MIYCEKCGAENLPDSKFCEVCGHELGTDPEPEAPDQSQDLAPEQEEDDTKPGSLRDEIPFLTGAVDQARARLEDWQQKSARRKTEKVRQKEYQQQAAEEKKESKDGLGSRIMSLLVGILAIAAFIYIVVRLPRGTNPEAIWSFAWETALEVIKEPG